MLVVSGRLHERRCRRVPLKESMSGDSCDKRRQFVRFIHFVVNEERAQAEQRESCHVSSHKSAKKGVLVKPPRGGFAF